MRKKILVIILAAVVFVSMGVVLFGLLGDCNTDSCFSTLNHTCEMYCHGHGGCSGYSFDYGVCENWLCTFDARIYCIDGLVVDDTIICIGICPK